MLASNLTSASWQVFSRLLDEALDREPSERMRWVEALPAEHEPLKPALRAMLEHGSGIEPAWMATLPRNDGVELPLHDSELQPGALVGPYRLLRELGTGGMGAVWLAERADGTLKRQVALKLPHATWSRGLAERMARERDILAALEHPNIARLYDAGSDAQGRPFLALEYVEGQPIDAYCRERALGIRARLVLLLQVAQAVAFAHSRLVIHRDLKPSNILVTGDGQVRLLDFGIAKLMEGERAQETQLTKLAGRALTPDYASPEQIRGEPIGTASDVYSLGVIAYELLAGARPYRLKRGSAAELEEAIATGDVPPASAAATDAAVRRELKGDLDAILNKALKKGAGDRYATVDALAADLRRSLDGQRVEARPDTLQYRVARFTRRYRMPLLATGATIAAFSVAIGVGATAIVTLALAAGLGLALWQVAVAKRERDRAFRMLDRQEAVLNFMNSLLTDAARAGEALTAEQLLKRCEALLRPELKADADVHACLLSMMSTQMQTLGNSAEAIRLGEDAIALIDASMDPDLRDRILIGHAMAIGWAGRDQEARAILERVLQRDSLPAIERSQAHHYAASLANVVQDGVAAVRHAEAALASHRSERKPSTKFEASLLANLGMAYSAQGRMADADVQLSDAYRRLESLGLAASPQGVTLLNNWGVLNDRAGDARRALELSERALALAGAAGRSAFLLKNCASSLEAQGRLTEAEAYYAECEQVAQQSKALPALLAAKGGLASVLLQRGEVAGAGQLLAEGDDLASALPPTHPQRIQLQLVRGRLALEAADHAAARAAFEDVIRQVPEQAASVMARLGLSESALRQQDAAAALSSAEAAKALAMRLQGGKRTSFRTGLAAVARARALEAGGRLPEARIEAAEAVAMLEATVEAAHPALAQARALAAKAPPP